MNIGDLVSVRIPRILVLNRVEGLKNEKLITLHEASMRQNPCNKLYANSISHARKAAHQDNVVVSLKENHALPIAMEGGHAKTKQNLLLLEALQATAQMEKGKMKQRILQKAHQITAQIEKGGHVKVKQSILLLETAQMEIIVHAKRAASRRCAWVCDERKNMQHSCMDGGHEKMKQNLLLLLGCLN